MRFAKLILKVFKYIGLKCQRFPENSIYISLVPEKLEAGIFK